MVARSTISRLLVAALVSMMVVAPLGSASAETMGSWTPSVNYPMAIAGDSCVTFSSQIYCVGGFDSSGNSHDDVYTATLSSSGIGSWTSATAYPTPVDSASCVNATAGIYCIGGEDGQTVLNSTYFGSVTSSGLGTWSAQADYPSDTAAPSCVVFDGYVYCVGGFNDNGDEVSSTYYAQISSGLTAWTETTQYPLAVDSASCFVRTGAMYCVGGETESNGNVNTPITNAYVAALGPSGIGQWAPILSYPTALAALSCAPYAGYAYCVGGFDISQLSSTSTYFVPIPMGTASWANATPYPKPIDTTSCVADLGYIYCVAGVSDTQSGQSVLDSTYYAPISVSTTSSTVPEFPVSAALPATLALALLVVGVLGRVAARKGAPSA